MMVRDLAKGDKVTTSVSVHADWHRFSNKTPPAWLPSCGGDCAPELSTRGLVKMADKPGSRSSSKLTKRLSS